MGTCQVCSRLLPNQSTTLRVIFSIASLPHTLPVLQVSLLMTATTMPTVGYGSVPTTATAGMDVRGDSVGVGSGDPGAFDIPGNDMTAEFRTADSRTGKREAEEQVRPVKVSVDLCNLLVPRWLPSSCEFKHLRTHRGAHTPNLCVLDWAAARRLFHHAPRQFDCMNSPQIPTL